MMAEKDDVTVENEIKKTKSNKKTIGVGINDMPIHLFHAFKEMARERYNDVHWVALQDLMRKAEAYDYLLQGYLPEQEQTEEKEDDEEGVDTFGGRTR